jgi:SAM-dependent methyltransferase
MADQLSSGRAKDFFQGLRHRIRVRRLGLNSDKDYREYLSVQFKRTFSKRNQIPSRRTAIVMEHMLEVGTLNADSAVLCIGPRDSYELEFFKRKGVPQVCGIDLFSRNPDILVMDMHAMTFPDDSFQAVHASHVLEHAFEVKKAVKEIVRVAVHGALVGVEVPIRYQTRGADRYDFGGVTGIHELFGSHIMQVFRSDEQPPGSPLNAGGTWVARTVFSIEKS